jgi:hypothetical protein
MDISSFIDLDRSQGRRSNFENQKDLALHPRNLGQGPSRFFFAFSLFFFPRYLRCFSFVFVHYHKIRGALTGEPYSLEQRGKKTKTTRQKPASNNPQHHAAANSTSSKQPRQ